MNVTFFLSHFLQAEVNDSGTQAEANQCDRSLALRKKEKKKCHQMVFSLKRETGPGIPKSLRHRAPARASPLKYCSNLVSFKGIRSPQSYAQFNMENSAHSEYFVCFDLQKINWRQSNDQKLQQSGCFKQNQNRCWSWFEISKWKPYWKNKIFLEMFQYREEAIIQKYWPVPDFSSSRFQAEWQQQHVMVIKNDVAFKLLFWTA